MSLDRPAADILAAAKLWLTSPPVPGGSETGDMPYLATAVYALVAVPTDRVATMATDPAWRLYVNPQWWGDAARTATEVGAGLAHHVWHLLADHAGRAGDMSVRGSTSGVWRVAADITIHELAGDLVHRAAEHPGPDPTRRRALPSVAPRGPGGARPTGPAVAARARALDDHHHLIGAPELGLAGGRAAEEYYAMLTGLPATDDDPDHDPAWLPRSHPPADGWGQDPAQVGAHWQVPGRGPGEWPAGASREGPDPSCGSGCDGVHRNYELPELSDAGGLSAVTAQAIRSTVAIEMQSHPGRGDLPGDWGRWVHTILDPVVDWRNTLRAAVRRGVGWANGQSDYTYSRISRISRRQAASGPVILPALRRPVPRVGVVVDTSGSVDDGLLAQALGEIDGVLAALGVADPQVHVLAVDAAVQAVTSVRRADAARLAGGGGTDMALGIRVAQELRPRVDVIIVLTDAHTGWPGRPADVPVIAVLIGRTRADLPQTPEWIQRVECVR